MLLAMDQLFPPSNTGSNHFDSEHSDQCEGYSMFCIIQVGSVIRETRLIFDIKPGTADIEFNEKLLL